MQEEQMRGQNKGIPPYLNYLGKMHGQNRVSSVLNAKKSIQGYIKKRINNTQKNAQLKKYSSNTNNLVRAANGELYVRPRSHAASTRKNRK
jgi:hypothetical protein